MPRFRKKPVVIDAMKFVLQDRDPGDVRVAPVIHWLDLLDPLELKDGTIVEVNYSDWVFAPDRIQIPTLEGVMRAELGDYIIRGVKGEFYPVKDEIFRMTYEEVVDAT